MPTTASRPNRHAGFSLIEMMIAVVVGLLIIGAMGSVFLGASRNYRQDNLLGETQDNLRFALAQLSEDTEMAGYWTQLFEPLNITVNTNLDGTADCGPSGWSGTHPWIYSNLTDAVTIIDNAVTGNSVNSQFSCISDSEVEPGTDVIAIKRVFGAESHEVTASGTTGTLDSNTTYLRTNGTQGVLYKYDGGTTDPGVSIPNSDWAYRPAIYFIRSYESSPGDGVPMLCREVLNSGPRFSAECLARGIENMQVEVGVDADIDGTPDYFVANPTPTQMGQAVALRIALLARSGDPDYRYTNSKTYTLDDVTVGPFNDHYYRRATTIVVPLRNPSALNAIGAGPLPKS